MILSAPEIVSQMKKGLITIEPFNAEQMNIHSYNLRLSNKLLIYTEELDLIKLNKTKEIEIPEHGLILYPGELYLGTTVEYTEAKTHICMIEGRSSLARLGLGVHIDAPMINVGNKGRWTLEITVVKPLKIYPNIEICQLQFYECKGIKKIDELYNGKYQNQNDIQISKFNEELNILENRFKSENWV